MKPLMNIQINQAREYDLEQILELISEHGFPISADDLHYRFNIYTKANLNKCWLAKKPSTNKIVGCVAILVNKSLLSEKFYVRVTNIFVPSKYRRLSVGKQLLKVVEDYICSLGQADLELIIPTTNKNIAQDFYANMGYKLTSNGDSYINIFPASKKTTNLQVK